jgi:hypothetical protein
METEKIIKLYLNVAFVTIKLPIWITEKFYTDDSINLCQKTTSFFSQLYQIITTTQCPSSYRVGKKLVTRGSLVTCSELTRSLMDRVINEPAH